MSPIEKVNSKKLVSFQRNAENNYCKGKSEKWIALFYSLFSKEIYVTYLCEQKHKRNNIARFAKPFH